jgi:periodic tryptophan protein 1
MVKVWNINEEEGQKREVSLVTSRDLGVVRSFPSLPVPFQPLSLSCFMATFLKPTDSSFHLLYPPPRLFLLFPHQQGKVFSLSFSPDSPLTVAAAGSKAKLQVWDLSTNGGARKAFGPRLRQAGRELREAREEGKGLIGVESDGEDSEEEMEE